MVNGVNCSSLVQQAHGRDKAHGRERQVHCWPPGRDHCRLSGQPCQYCDADCWLGINSLLSRKTCNRLCTTRCNSLERNDKFDTGLNSLGCCIQPLFFDSRRTMACLNSEGKHPVTSDLLSNMVINWDSSLCISFTSHGGDWASWHVLFGDMLISLFTSLVLND